MTYFPVLLTISIYSNLGLSVNPTTFSPSSTFFSYPFSSLILFFFFFVLFIRARYEAVFFAEVFDFLTCTSLLK